MVNLVDPERVSRSVNKFSIACASEFVLFCTLPIIVDEVRAWKKVFVSSQEVLKKELNRNSYDVLLLFASTTHTNCVMPFSNRGIASQQQERRETDSVFYWYSRCKDGWLPHAFHFSFCSVQFFFFKKQNMFCLLICDPRSVYTPLLECFPFIADEWPRTSINIRLIKTKNTKQNS
jgi:hypothetical protein